ncbi:MAG: hypothetical protein O9333_16115 [Beijerinckiaceae bacterium]|nr:hypothetical protein [Beijerinckiaceae bacterium]
MSAGFPDVGERCSEYLSSNQTLKSAEDRLDALTSNYSKDAKNLFSLVKSGKKFFREHEITLTMHRNSVRLTHANFLVLSITTMDGFVVCSGRRSGANSPRLKVQLGDLDIARITTVRLIEDAVDAVAQHLVRCLSEEKTHA